MKTNLPCYQYIVPVYLFFFVFCLTSYTQAQKAPVPSPNAESFNSRLATVPLLFTENKGQVADKAGNPRPDILFTAHSAGIKIYLTATGIHYQFEKTILPEGYEPDERKVKDREKQEALRKQIATQTSRFTLSLKGANPTLHIRKEVQNAYTENFYLANCAVTGVHTYERLVYENVYPGIDWVIYSRNQHLEHDFIVHPGANPSLIKLKVTDAKANIVTGGRLVMTTELGEVKEAAPVSYCDGEKVSTAFRRAADGNISFAIETWNKSKDLKIDPSVTWATYYGGNNWDIGYSCTSDLQGNVYMSGYTESSSNIASGGFQNVYGRNDDAFLVKFGSNGSRLWATYYGGSGSEYGYSCALDTSGNVYLAGRTSSTTGIASGGFQNIYGGGYNDAFLVKFSSSGVRLWATYYGGDNDDNGFSCVIDVLGNVYISGCTGSLSNIAFNGFQSIPGSNAGLYDAFLVKFSSSGVRLWATYYGGGDSDFGFACIVDTMGNIYLAGKTSSINNIASGGFQNTNGGEDAFLAKFNSSGIRLWATYYGGSSSEWGYSCAADMSGNVYLSGYTSSTSGIASGGFQNTLGGGGIDAFLVKFDSNGGRLWATYYGGNDIDDSRSCAVDGYGNVYLVGRTFSTTGIAAGGVQNIYKGGQDAFVVKFNSNGGRVWGTYYGGNGEDDGYFCSSDPLGNVYFSGTTSSTSNIASSGFQNTYGGSAYDAYLVKISDPNLTGFTSIANGNWNNPAIWSGGVVPTAGSVVIINTTVTVTANASCYSLTVNPSGSITVSPGINLTVLN